MIVFSSGDLQTWEAEAKVYRDKSTPVSIIESRVITWHHCEVWIVHVRSSSQNLLFLEVPPYREPNIYHPVKVNFHVLNGKKHCSQAPHFTYTPLSGEIFNPHVNKWRLCCLPGVNDLTSCSVPQIKAEPVEDYHYAQLGGPIRPAMGVSPPSCRLAGGCMLPSGHSHSSMYPTAHLQHPPAHYQLEHAVPVGSPGRASCMSAARGATSLSQFGPNVYQNTTVSDGIQATAYMFPTLDVSELCSAAGHQRAYGSRASPTPGRSPPVHTHQHTYLTIQHQRTSSPVRLNIKQENLDQAYLDDGLWTSQL